MCFVPKVSLATALIEFFAAGWMYYRFPRKTLTIFFSIIVALLGLYQMTEFLLCTVGQPEIWGKAGFIVYALIPSVTVFYTITLVKSRPNFFLVFAPALFFIISAFLDPNFVIQGTCSTMFVTVRNKFSFPNSRILPFSIFALYYYSYLAIATAYLFWGIIKSESKKKTFLYLLMLSSIFLTLFPPLVLIIIFPYLGIKFPSVYCQFAMLLTLTGIIGLYIENRPEKK